MFNHDILHGSFVFKGTASRDFLLLVSFKSRCTTGIDPGGKVENLMTLSFLRDSITRFSLTPAANGKNL